MPKPTTELPIQSEPTKETLGISPGVLAKRNVVKTSTWCPPKPDVEFDPWCDPDNPKTITYKDIVNAAYAIKEDIPMTPLKRSKFCEQFDVELIYKLEILQRTGSFNDRKALYCLKMLNYEQSKYGVITASTGNWAMALAYHGQKLNIPVTVVLPVKTHLYVVDNCHNFKANVVLHGTDLAEAKHQAFVMTVNTNFTYINGYDHPHAIAASGTIGLEILDKLPQTDVILVPIGGGGLIAGIASAVKQIKPEIQIYGIEPDKCCSFFKAMENEWPYQTKIDRSIANSLAVPNVGYNAFHTARSLIDKMILVDDDWITRTILHFMEDEKLVVEGAGATSLSGFFALPKTILPELKGKTVVCVITGGNIDSVIMPWCLERGRAIEGRLIKLTVKLPVKKLADEAKVLSIIANVGCNVVQCYREHAWLIDDDFLNFYVTLICETRNLSHACTLKRVMERFFPNICEFLEEPFSPIPICRCFPKNITF